MSSLKSRELRVESREKSNSLVPNGTRSSLTAPTYTPAFETWWKAYGKVGSKAEAFALWLYWKKAGAQPEDLILAATNYHAHCGAVDQFQAHGRTFLSKNPNRWQEWVKPEEKPNGNNGHRSGRQLDTSMSVIRNVLEREGQ
jgi:hypothetical protein